ncbi:MAG: hypothetical protein KGH79_04465, partial [Patescibacteria group bacterium]|nr:hypothetical protein [Patescibacteria group bacterium]
MDFFKRLLSNDDARRTAMLAAAALLIVGGVWLSKGGLAHSFATSASIGAQSQAAATALGDAQGVPSGYTGQTYPAFGYCYDYAESWPTRNYYNYPDCNGTNTFGIFSANPQGVLQGASTYFNFNQSLTSVAVGPDTAVQNCSSKAGCTTSYSCSSYGLITGAKSGDTGYISGTECYEYVYYLPTGTVNNQPGASGSTVYTSIGQPVTLQWSCQPSRVQEYTTCNFQNPLTGNCDDSAQNDPTIYYSSSAAAAGDSSFTGTKTTTGSVTVAPTVTTTYALTCSGGQTIQLSNGIGYYIPPALSITVNVSLPSCSISASSPVSDGGQATLTYTTTGSPTSISIADSDGDPVINPASSPVKSAALSYAKGSPVTFTMTVTNSKGQGTTCQGTTVVNPNAPTVTLLPSSQTIEPGQSAPFTYTLGGAAPTSITYTVDGGASVPASGGAFSVSGLSTGTHTVIMTVANAGGSNISNAATVTVSQPDQCTDISPSPSVPPGCQTPNPVPGICIPSGDIYSNGQCIGSDSITLSANPTVVQRNGSSVLTWTTNNMTSCGITGSDGSTPLAAGTPVIYGQHTTNVSNISKVTTYTLQCTGVDTRSQQVTVR